MSCSASSTEATEHGRAPRGRSTVAAGDRVRRAVARLLATTIVFVTPGGAWAGSELPQADAARTRNGFVDNTIDGQTTVTSFDHMGKTVWDDGLNQPEGHTLYFDLPELDSIHLNIVGGDFAAHLNGQVRSVDPNAEHTLVFASPYGVFVGPNALIDVGKLVAVGADLSNAETLAGAPLPLTGPVVIEGTVKASQGALLYGTHVMNLGEILTPAGQLLMLGGEALHVLGADTIVEGLLDPIDFTAALGDGVVWNGGSIEARDATLVGRRVINQGHIRIDDGTLLMAAGDMVHLRRYEDPVVVSLPQSKPGAIGAVDDARPYAIDQQGTIDARRGHVRLSAADALGWGIRQGSRTHDETPSIVAREIEIDAGEGGRVELAGRIDARGEGDQRGGDVTVTGETIALVGVDIDASSEQGDAGSIRIGGEQQGGGDLQRAKAVVMDAESRVRADGGDRGDGGRVILFSEYLTHLTGAISARGGELAGDGGFIETSGLRHFHIDQTPDASAPAGDGGEWLIDPYTINIVLNAPDCPAAGDACLNQALEQVLLPSFDDAGFDNVLRTLNEGSATRNDISADLIVRALSVGTDVTLSTEAFDPDGVDGSEFPVGAAGQGDINVETAILIPDGAAAQGTRARLVLRAARDVNVNADILAGPGGATGDMVLDVELRANDQRQRDPAADFDRDQLLGSVNIDADIRTGGGDLLATGVAVTQNGDVETGGGLVNYVSGSRDRFDFATAYERDDTSNLLEPPGFPTLAPLTPGVTVAGNIDTRRYADDPGAGGDVAMNANAFGVRTTQAGDDDLEIFTGELLVSGDITTGGGDVELVAGTRNTTDVGNVTITGATIDTSRAILTDADAIVRREGGNVRIDANRLDDEDTSLVSLVPVFSPDTEAGRGGRISIGGDATIRTRGGDISVGSSRASAITIQGTLNTTHSTDLANATDDLAANVDASATDNGMIAIVAMDTSGVDTSDTPPRYGDGSIEVGGTGGATLLSSALTLQSRDVTLLAGANSAADAVTIRLAGDSDTTIDASSLGLSTEEGESTDFATVGTLRFEADYLMTFEGNAAARAERIEVVAASRPSELNATETADAVRLVFAGDDTAANGTTLEADAISIEIGDGTTTSDDLDFIDPADADNADLIADRIAIGSWAGLRLRDATGALRPESVSIQQDGDLRVAGAAGTDLYFGGRSGSGSTDGIFGGAAIGVDGQEIVLESRDGTLEVTDAAGLSDDLAPGTGETDGRSFVTLHGGLVLPSVMGGSVADSVVIDAGAGFDLHSLTITSPRDLTVTAPGSASPSLELQTAIVSVDELVVQTGRPVPVSLLDVDGDTLGGTLTVEDGVTLTATDSLELHAAARGFGDLVFDSPTATELRSSAISLRAGGGTSSEETNASRYAAISGADQLAYRRADGGDFLNGTTAESFSYRQDAAIDGDVDLPGLANFVAGAPPANFGGPTDAIAYALRSDFGGIDLTGVGANQVENTHLSLIGFGEIAVDPTFEWDGPSLELGGTASFVYTTALSDAFTSSDPSPGASTTERVRLRAGLDQVGTLAFASGAIVRAPIIELVAGDGFGGETGSPVVVSGAVFDHQDAVELGLDPTFVFHEDQTTLLTDLPLASQFTGGLPEIIGVRNDTGLIDLTNPDFTTLPFTAAGTDLTTPATLILEAQIIGLRASSGLDLELTGGATGLENLRLRLRADTIDLRATGGNETLAGRILAGERGTAPTTSLAAGGDANFDDPSLIIEGYDEDAEFLATTNLSALSRAVDPGDATNTDYFDLAQGRGPEIVALDQDGDATPDELPLRWHVGGEFGASTADDALGVPIPTVLRLDSNFGNVTVDPHNVSGARVEIGNEFAPIFGELRFEGVDDDAINADEDDFVVDDLVAFATEKIVVGHDADIRATGPDGEIRLEAGVLLDDPNEVIDASNPFFGIEFERSLTDPTARTDLRANTITLTAGPAFEFVNPDGTNGAADGEFDEITDGLAEIDILGLASIDIEDPSALALFTARQSASFDTAPLIGTFGASEWDTIDLTSIEGSLHVTNLAVLGAVTRQLRAGVANGQDDGFVEITRDGSDTAAAIFDAETRFQGGVTIESNDIRFVATTGPDLRLDTPNLRVVSTTFVDSVESLAERGQVNGDLDALDRPSITVTQDSDFSATRLVRPDRYSQLGFDFTTANFQETLRDSLSRVTIQLVTTGDVFRFGDDLRDDVRDANLTIATTSDLTVPNELVIDIDSLAPGVRDYAFGSVPEAQSTDFAAISLNSFETREFDRITIADYDPVLPEGGPAEVDLTLETTGDQSWNRPTDPTPGTIDPGDPTLDIRLQSGLDVAGRDIRFGGDLFTDSTTEHFGLFVRTRGEVRFEGDLGQDAEAPDADQRLASLWVVFDDDVRTDTPVVQFGRRLDLDGDEDGIEETPIASPQAVLVEDDIVFVTAPLDEPDDPEDVDDSNRLDDFRTAIENATTLTDVDADPNVDKTAADNGDIEDALTRYAPGRVTPSAVATIGKAAGDLRFESANGGHFVMGSGERLAVGGNVSISHAGGLVTLGDVAAIGDTVTPGIDVDALDIGLVRRNAGVTRVPDGATTPDPGSLIVSNSFDFGGVTPTTIGVGKDVLFGVPDPRDGTGPSFLAGFGVVANRPDGGSIGVADFTFAGGSARDQVAFPLATGASRSELTGAFGPREEPILVSTPRDLPPLDDRERLLELDVDARPTPSRILRARLAGAAIIDDVALGRTSAARAVPVTAARLDAADAEAAIELYESLFGAEGERANQVRSVLQEALDRYLETTRARRVIGFELRRFVKNRPSTLLEAYSTLDQLDSLFRYHRRLGLSPGEFREIQARWLASIQPEGITLDELSEAIHPSRYVRGSDILDIFGR